MIHEQTYSSNDDLVSFSEVLHDMAEWAEKEDYDATLEEMQQKDHSGDLNTTDLLGIMDPTRVHRIANLLRAVSRVNPGELPDQDRWDDIVFYANVISAKEN